jgi:hypothetical protein
MRPLSWWYYNALAGLLDAAMGMAIVAASSWALGRLVEPEWLAVGAMLALLPDIDIMPAILRGKVEGDHRTTWWHAPLVVIPIAMIVAFVLGGVYWMLVAVACLLWHYAHDTFDGVRWLRPFSPYYWSYRGRHVRFADKHDTWLKETWGRESVRAWAELPPALLLAIFAWVAVLAA